MNVGKLHEVIHEMRLAQTWCDGDGQYLDERGMPVECVSVSKKTLREWADRLESALQDSAIEYRIVFDDYGGNEHTREITFRDWGPNQNWPGNMDDAQRLNNALTKLEDYRRFKRVYAETARALWLEKRYVGPWERVKA